MAGYSAVWISAQQGRAAPPHPSVVATAMTVPIMVVGLIAQAAASSPTTLDRIGMSAPAAALLVLCWHASDRSRARAWVLGTLAQVTACLGLILPFS
jgi:hypothetical protein